MTPSRRILGQAGEELAAATLKRQGYKILERNYTTPLGEVDLIAQHQGALVFVEIKTRKSKTFGSAREAISSRKQARLHRVAQYYLKHRRLTPRPMRFDVVAISVQGQDIKVEIIPYAFGG
ncbi:MAG: YraN family protein [Deltaproteobacteria bacterium]|nr:YraN family protein [Deltaproteobacteria bacterium]